MLAAQGITAAIPSRRHHNVRVPYSKKLYGMDHGPQLGLSLKFAILLARFPQRKECRLMELLSAEHIV